VTVTSSPAALKCSFEGGCKYEVKATPGLSSLLKSKPEDNYIKICEKKCAVVAADSVSGTTVCKVPSVSTTYSNQNFDRGSIREFEQWSLLWKLGRKG